MAILQQEIIQRPVADVTTLKALDVTLYADGEIIIVKAKGIYRYDPLSSATPDDDKVVLPSVGPGRWIRMTNAEADGNVEDFTDLGDVSGFYTDANSIVTTNDSSNGLVESPGTLSSTGALKVVSAQLSLGSVVNEISNDTTVEDKATTVVTEHVVYDVKANIQTQLNAKAPDFDGDQIFWVSGNGSDTLNNGKDDNKPFATFNKGLTEARLLTPVAGNEFAIVCLEGGDFTEDLLVDSYCHVYAPNATINGQITVEADASIVLKNLKYSGTGVALTRSGGGIGPGFFAAELISCTSTGDAIENASSIFELNIDRVEVNNGNGLQITGTNTKYTSGYINSIVCVNGGNCVDVSGLNVLAFAMSFGSLSSSNGSAISLTSNAKLNINAIEVSGSNAYVVNSATAELNLSVTKLAGNETVTLGTANVINPSGNSSLGGNINIPSINTVAWPAAGGAIGDVPTLTATNTAVWTAPSGGGVSAIPKNMLVSGDFAKIPLWIQSIGLTAYADGTLVTPSFLILHNTTAQAQRLSSFTDQNELVLQLTGSGYLGGYEPLYAEEYHTAFADLKTASKTLSVGLYGRATGITQIKMDIIQWVPGTAAACIRDPIATWGATPTLDSDATGTWSYVASSSALTISGTNSIIKWENISTASFNTAATRLGLLIRTAGTETSGDNIIIKKLAMHRGASFVGFEDRDEVTKTETRIACTYNFRYPKGTTTTMDQAIYSGFFHEFPVDDMAHIANFNYNTSLIDIPAPSDVVVYNPFTGTAGSVRDTSGSNAAIETIDAVSQHSVSVVSELEDGWGDSFKMHVIVWPKAYQ